MFLKVIFVIFGCRGFSAVERLIGKEFIVVIQNTEKGA